MSLITDLVDLAELTAVAREVEDPATWSLAALLPEIEIDDVEYALTSATIQRGVAQYRAFDAPTPIGKRTASRTKTRQPLLPLGQMLRIGEYERILLQRAQGALNESLVNSIFDDTRSNVQAIRARLEQARGQVLSTGSFTLTNENGLSDVAVFGVPAGNLGIAPTLLFSDPTSDLFGFLDSLGDYYASVNDEGQRPGSYTVSTRVVNAIRKNKQIIRSQYGATATEGRVTFSEVNAILIDEGLPPLAINDTKIAGKRVIPDHKIIVGPANAGDLGHTVYGITVEALELQGSNAVDFVTRDLPGITATVLKEDNPVSIYSKASAVALPALDRPELLATADVLTPAA